MNIRILKNKIFDFILSTQYSENQKKLVFSFGNQITFLIYGLALHPKVPFITNRFWFHVSGLLAFSTVLMNYFGVNYMLGGMHSYAGEMDMTGTWVERYRDSIFALPNRFAYRKSRLSQPE